MAQYKDVLPSQSGWIHELARAEVHPDAEKLLQLGSAFDPQQMVEEATINFLTELREFFNEFSRTFNGYSEAGGKFTEVKVYSLAQTAADFMVYRNQIKLVITNSAHGVILIAFTQHQQPSQSMESVEPNTQELLAQVGPFRDVSFTFQGEKVTPDQVAKFYFAEFVRATRDTRRSRVGNQLLLDQIKALLQEKGLDL